MDRSVPNKKIFQPFSVPWFHQLNSVRLKRAERKEMSFYLTLIEERAGTTKSCSNQTAHAIWIRIGFVWGYGKVW